MEDARILLCDGQPIRFGADGRKGIAARNMEPQVVDLEDGQASVGELLVHDTRAGSPALVALLAALEPPDFPMALGVFRDVERPTYDALLMEQIDNWVVQRGGGDLHNLLNAGTTWEVD
jgi:2-oxoglutarate ferredoxin oxidoreductase subunit beta